MRFSSAVLVVTLLGHTFAAPANTAAFDIPGVTIINAGISNPVPNSYIVVYKDGAKASDIATYEKKVKKKLVEITDAAKYTGIGTHFDLPGFSGFAVHTSRDGLAAFGNDKVVRSPRIEVCTHRGQWSNQK
jgi:hypothetical protein